MDLTSLVTKSTLEAMFCSSKSQLHQFTTKATLQEIKDKVFRSIVNSEKATSLREHH